MNTEIVIAVISSAGVILAGAAQLSIGHYYGKKDKNDARYEELKKAQDEQKEVLAEQAEKVDRMAERDELTNRLLIGFGHFWLVSLTDQISARGCITMKELATLDDMGGPYLEMGGNGYGKTGYSHCKSLPVVSEEEAAEIDKRRAFSCS